MCKYSFKFFYSSKYFDTSIFILYYWFLNVIVACTSETCFFLIFPEKKWRLAKLQFHWGGTNQQGSEHTIDGKAFAAEVIVTYLVSYDFYY